MDPMRIIEQQARATRSRILWLVMDGLGDIPGDDGSTPLSAARTPNLDRLAAEGCSGRFDPVGPGITPGSGPGHLGLFGYDPTEYEIGRGALSAVGIEFPLHKGDVAARFNFCTVDGDGNVTDRRAGRIPTEENHRLVKQLRGIEPPAGVTYAVETESEHRGVLVLRGDGLEPFIGDTDPQATGRPPLPVEATRPEGERAAAAVRHFVDRAFDVLAGEERANGVLLRGFDTLPTIPSMTDRFALTPVCIASYPMYRGLARLVGMDLPPAPGGLDEFPAAVAERRDRHDFFFVHVKYTDKAGEDGDFGRKREVVETVDALLPKIMEVGFEVVCVTADHSTPVPHKAHSWHPVPALLWSPGRVFRDGVTEFSEQAAIAGGLGRMPLRYLIAEALAAAGKLEKFGA